MAPRSDNQALAVGLFRMAVVGAVSIAAWYAVWRSSMWFLGLPW